MDVTPQMLIARLVATNDFEHVLKELCLSPLRAIAILCDNRGKQQLAARKALAKIHSELMANRFSAHAVQRLCELLQSEKPDMRLRSANSILSVAGISGRKRIAKKTDKNAPNQETSPPTTAEDGVIMELLAELIRQRMAAPKPSRPGQSGLPATAHD